MPLTLLSLSLYAAITKWIHQWKKNDWQSSTGSDVKNQADIKALDHLCNLIDVRWVGIETVLFCAQINN